jgi:hypothetical protein
LRSIYWRRLAKPELTYDLVAGFFHEFFFDAARNSSSGRATIITRRKQQKNSLKGGGEKKSPEKTNQLSSQTQISTTKTSAVGTLLKLRKSFSATRNLRSCALALPHKPRIS